MTRQQVKLPDFVSREALVRQIHESPLQIVLVATGGGTLAVSDLLTIPGGSGTLIEAIVPYSADSLAAFLNFAPVQHCSAATARQMASRAFEHAVQRHPDGPTAGIACTASLVADRAKRGDHRLHVAIQSIGLTAVASLKLLKGERDRAAEERIAADVILNQLAEACGVAGRLAIDLLPDEKIETDKCEPETSWRELLRGQSSLATRGPYDPANTPRIVYPGAFHPLHAGHLGIAKYALARFPGPLAYEVSIENPDKPTLDYLDMRERCSQFAPEEIVIFTRAATFAEKAELFPGTLFLVGADTIARIDDRHYYDDCQEFRDEAIARLAARGCRFLVFGRQVGDQFQELGDFPLGNDLRRICEPVPGDAFRMDVSSTELRSEK